LDSEIVDLREPVILADGYLDVRLKGLIRITGQTVSGGESPWSPGNQLVQGAVALQSAEKIAEALSEKKPCVVLVARDGVTIIQGGRAVSMAVTEIRAVREKVSRGELFVGDIEGEHIPSWALTEIVLADSTCWPRSLPAHRWR
jgi:hypothetical protein